MNWDENKDSNKDYSYNVMICAKAGTEAVAVYDTLFIRHQGPESECTVGDIVAATELLSIFALSIAMSTFHDSVMESMTEVDIAQVPSVGDVIATIDAAKDELCARFDLPSVKQSVALLGPTALAARGIRVAKAKVSKTTSLPDPYLVAVKAAVNWFAGRKQEMLAAASVYDSEHSDSDTDSGYNDLLSSPPPVDDPVESLRNSLSSGSHFQLELFFAD